MQGHVLRSYFEGCIVGGCAQTTTLGHNDFGEGKGEGYDEDDGGEYSGGLERMMFVGMAGRRV